MELKIALGALVKLRHSDETGEVIGRAEYSHSEPAYYVRYKASNGQQVEQWWGESAILV